jgi:hypothetical protein
MEMSDNWQAFDIPQKKLKTLEIFHKMKNATKV